MRIGAPQNFNRSPVGGYPLKPPSFERPHFISEEPGRFPFPAGIHLPRKLMKQVFVESTEPDFLNVDSTLNPLGNEDLPIYPRKLEIQQSLAENQVTLIVGETGSGKSTQVSQYAMEMGFNVYLTQPRRAATYNVFSRTRSEVSEKRGEAVGYREVSYRTAATQEGPDDATIKLETDGLRLVSEYGSAGIKTGDLLIADEIHEFNVNMEFLLAAAKRAIKENPKLRLVIMSATVDADKIANYFNDACVETPNIINVDGRMFPVERIEEPDSTVLIQAVKSAREVLDNPVTTNDGVEANGIQIFVEGKREISDLIDKLHTVLPAWILKKAIILPLHAKQTLEEQKRAFMHYDGVKITVSTNVAQTSLTIPDTRVVIDTGRERRIVLDEEGVQGLVLNEISQADCDQRSGRAGRVVAGKYILTRPNEYTPFRSYISREKYPVPEILRTDVIRNTLRLAAVGLNITEEDLLHKVNITVIEQAQRALRQLGALDAENNITELGKVMDRFPVGASSGRMIAEAQRFASRTREYVAVIAAAVEVGGLQNFDLESGKAWRELTAERTSDLLAQLDLFINTLGMNQRQLHEMDIDVSNLERAHEVYRKLLQRQGLQVREILPPSEAEKDDILQCIYSGMIDSIYVHVGDKLYQKITNQNGNVRKLSNRSVVEGKPELVVGVPYRVEGTKPDGTHFEHHIIERVTLATAASLGRLATHLTRWEPGERIIRDGRIYETERQFLGNIDMGFTREVPAKPSDDLYQDIIQYAIDNPGRHQNSIRAIKKELEKLAHLAKDPVPQLTQEAYIRHIAAAIPRDATDLTRLDTYIREYIEQGNISLEMFVPEERRQMILDNAPPTIKVGDVTLRIQYKNCKPIVETYRTEDIFSLTEDPFLPDGRQILFVKRLPNVAGYKAYDLFDKSADTEVPKPATRGSRSSRHKICSVQELQDYLEELQARGIQP